MYVSSRLYKVIFIVYKAFTSSKQPYLWNMLISEKQIRATHSSHRRNVLEILKTCKNGYNVKAFAVAGSCP